MATQFKIESNVPTPKGVETKYPFRQLGIGQSVLIPTSFRDETTARNAAYTWARANMRQFTCRKVDGGLRVWRVK